jgi:UDP-N-acetylmuramate--alanine ligase
MFTPLHNNVHFVGIGGIGMSALAKLLLTANCHVSGSNSQINDQVKSLQKRGLKIFIGHDAANILPAVQAVIHTSAVDQANPELKQARNQNVPIFDYHEYLGLLSQQFKTIAIAGTHGKSTTTALVGKILAMAGWKPTVIVGSKVPGFDENFLNGAGDYLVVEADEYNFGMLHLKPEIILLNNIEADHLDCYGNLENIIASFSKFVQKLPTDGCLLYNADDNNIKKIINDINCSKVKVSSCGGGDFVYQPSQNKKLVLNNEQYQHQLYGFYNDANLAMAISLALYLKIDLSIIKKTIKDFTGIWRRFEVIATNAYDKNITIISDYAHHPTALACVIQAAKDAFPKQKIWTIFQPHHYDRVSNFFYDFITVLKTATNPVVVQTYDVPGRESHGQRSKTSQDIAAQVPGCIYLDDVNQVADFIKNNACVNEVVLAIGAGTIDEVVRNAKISQYSST